MAPDQQLVTEIARCTKVKKFRGRLTEGAARKLPQVKPLIRIAVVGPVQYGLWDIASYSSMNLVSI